MFLKILDAALRDTVRRFEETGSPVITDGEQAKPSFATYPLTGVSDLAANGVTIPFGFAPFADASTGRDIAFAKIQRE